MYVPLKYHVKVWRGRLRICIRQARRLLLEFLAAEAFDRRWGLWSRRHNCWITSQQKAYASPSYRIAAICRSLFHAAEVRQLPPGTVARDMPYGI